MQGFRSKLVCLSKPVNAADKKGTNLTQNIFIFCILRVRNVL